jgi:hypothetical protein
MKTPIRLREPALPIPDEPQALEIPRHLPPVVRDVAESLLLRDPESARRYLQIHQEQRNGK